MKLLAPSFAVLLSFAPALAGASSGTLHFRGALVEPTCQAEVLDGAANAGGRVSVRLFDCRATPASPLHGTAANDGRLLSGPVQPLTLSGTVAQLAGRVQLDVLTFSYQ